MSQDPSLYPELAARKASLSVYVRHLRTSHMFYCVNVSQSVSSTTTSTSVSASTASTSSLIMSAGIPQRTPKGRPVVISDDEDNE